MPENNCRFGKIANYIVEVDKKLKIDNFSIFSYNVTLIRASTAPQTSEIVVDNFVVVYDKKASTNITLVRDGSRRQQKRPVLYVEFPSLRMQAVSFSILDLHVGHVGGEAQKNILSILLWAPASVGEKHCLVCPKRLVASQELFELHCIRRHGNSTYKMGLSFPCLEGKLVVKSTT